LERFKRPLDSFLLNKYKQVLKKGAYIEMVQKFCDNKDTFFCELEASYESCVKDV